MHVSQGSHRLAARAGHADAAAIATALTAIGGAALGVGVPALWFWIGSVLFGHQDTLTYASLAVVLAGW